MSDTRFVRGVCHLCGREGEIVVRGGQCRLPDECLRLRQENIWYENPSLAPEGFFGEEMRRRPWSAW